MADDCNTLFLLTMEYVCSRRYTEFSFRGIGDAGGKVSDLILVPRLELRFACLHPLHTILRGWFL
jgi:hypothetical protein